MATDPDPKVANAQTDRLALATIVLLSQALRDAAKPSKR